jgi:hypothetical protein
MAARLLGLGSFEWRRAQVRLEHVHPVGEDGAKGAQLLAIVGADVGEPYDLEARELRVYDALADLDPDALEIDPQPLIGFAAEWGWLVGGRELYAPVDPASPAANALGFASGERVEGWIAAVRELRDARELWAAWSAKNARAMSELVEVRTNNRGERSATFLGGTFRQIGLRQVEREIDGKVIKVPEPIFEPVRRGRSQLFHVPHPRGDLRAAALDVLLAMIESRAGSGRFGFERDARAPHGVALMARPQTLIECAWVQMANHVWSGDTVRRCANPECSHTWTEEGAKTGPEKVFHSKPCGVADWRRRQASAKRSGSRKRKRRT